MCKYSQHFRFKQEVKGPKRSPGYQKLNNGGFSEGLISSKNLPLPHYYTQFVYSMTWNREQNFIKIKFYTFYQQITFPWGGGHEVHDF